MRDWMRHVQAVQLDGDEHAQEALVDIRSWSGLPTGQPMFEHLFVFENYPAAAPLRLDDTVELIMDEVVEETDLPLTLVILPDDDIALRSTFDTGRFDAAGMARTLSDLLAVLARFCDDPAAMLRDVSIPLDADQSGLESPARDLEAEPRQPDAPVHELVEQQARLRPDDPTLIAGDDVWTYRAINEQANGRAHQLISLGVGPDDVVGVLAGRRPDVLADLLAILKAGAAFLVLDPEHPRSRLELMIEVAEPRVLLVDSVLGHLVHSDPGIAVVDRDVPVAASSTDPTSRCRPDNLAYVVFTSGSTGAPKGIGMVHRALGELIGWQVRDTRASSDSHVPERVFSFDVSLQEMFGAWTTGGTLVFVPPRCRADFDELVQLADRMRIERWYLPAVALQHVADAVERGGMELGSLTTLISGSESLHMTDAIRALVASTRCELRNEYGPSETHVVTAWSGPPGAAIPASPPIGMAVPHATIRVLDPKMRALPVGVAGEVYIGGTGLARGYLGRPGLTAERFVPDPYGPPGSRLYRSGDRARRRATGELEFLGRLDNQVKVRGYRVELAELEIVVGRTPGVDEVVVVAAENPVDGTELVAYVVGRADEAAVRDFARTHLPAYMVPRVVRLDRLPLNVNRKVDKQALPSASSNAVGPSGEPQGAGEALVARVWADVLGVDTVGRDDDFFDLGGHSLLAVRATGLLRELLGIELGVSAVIDERTPAGMVERVARAVGGAQALDELAAAASRSHAGGDW